MGTNYYWYAKDGCPGCGRDYEKLHIGKTSGGWCFSLHVHPEERINTLKDWQEHYSTGLIKDEYGDVITSEEMTTIITKREYLQKHMEAHSPNMIIGPNNLLRHPIDNYHCIGHGEGTWDYIIGYFS